jgi:CheY-like chemotaxis protein
MGHFQQSLQEAKEIAEKATETKTNFLSNISHEIRTPMNAIMGLTELLVPQEKDPEKLEYLQAIQYSSDNLLRLINDLLDLNKMEANKMALDHSPVAIRELLHQFEKVMRYLIRDRSVDIQLVIDDSLPAWVSGDQVRLNQILMNLGSNAAKFTESGEIAVRAKVLADEEKSCLVRFTFRDTGIGIAPEKLDSIFESFEQADKQISRKYGGTGLGLTITRKLVDMMGGTIRVQSEPGVGSTFTVELKFDKVERTGAPQQDLASLQHKDLHGARILVVEDNKINAMLATKLLSNWNSTYEVAENGLEGMEKLRAKPYDLVLLDLQMPVMDGFELIQKIRAGEAGAQTDIPVIALTADAFDQTKGKALDLGFSDFVSKPLKADELFMKIQAWLQPKPAQV